MSQIECDGNSIGHFSPRLFSCRLLAFSFRRRHLYFGCTQLQLGVYRVRIQESELEPGVLRRLQQAPAAPRFWSRQSMFVSSGFASRVPANPSIGTRGAVLSVCRPDINWVFPGNVAGSSESPTRFLSVLKMSALIGVRSKDLLSFSLRPN